MSSFRKIKVNKPVSGTQVSLQNGQLLTSCGNPSLDHIIGGGMAIGSIMVIEEDRFVTHSRALAKYFMAEGAQCGHTVFLGSLDEDPSEMIRKLPSVIESQHQPIDTCVGPPIIDNDIRIAWRYRNLPKVDSEESSLYIGHNFDLTRQISDHQLSQLDTVFWSKNCDNNNFASQYYKNLKIFKNMKFYSLLQKLSQTINGGSARFSKQISDSANQSLLRVCLPSLGSPLWYDKYFANDFIKFLTILKSIIRKSSVVCFLTIPGYLVKILDEHLISKIRNLVDYSIELESYAGSKKTMNVAFREYHGLLHVRKLTALNSLANFMPETTDLVFKLKRKKFVVEKLHLPPVLQSTKQREQDETSLSCGSSQHQLLEF